MTESAQTLPIGKYENKLGAVLEITGSYLPRPGALTARTTKNGDA